MDRIAVERAFALAKHSYGLGLITAKMDLTTRNAIAMSILAMNIDRMAARYLLRILEVLTSRFYIINTEQKLET